MKRYEVQKDTVDMFLKAYYTWRNEPGDDALGEPFENKKLFDKLSKIFSVKVKYTKGGAFIEYPNAYVKFLKMDYYDRKTSFKYKLRQWVYDKGIFKSGRPLFKILDFTQEYVNIHRDDKGQVSMEVVFDSLIAGEYRAGEMSVSRYRLENITDIENGVREDDEVLFDLKNTDHTEGRAVFINRNYEQRNYSDTQKVINRLEQ